MKAASCPLQELHLAKIKTTDAEELEKLVLHFPGISGLKHESTLKSYRTKYDTVIKLLSNMMENESCPPVSSQWDWHTSDVTITTMEKRKSWPLSNNLVMASNMSLNNTAKPGKKELLRKQQ